MPSRRIFSTVLKNAKGAKCGLLTLVQVLASFQLAQKELGLMVFAPVWPHRWRAWKGEPFSKDLWQLAMRNIWRSCRKAKGEEFKLFNQDTCCRFLSKSANSYFTDEGSRLGVPKHNTTECMDRDWRCIHSTSRLRSSLFLVFVWRPHLSLSLSFFVVLGVIYGSGCLPRYRN